MILVNDIEIKFDQFPNKEIRIELKQLLNVHNKIAYIDWKYEDSSDLIKLLFIKKELDNYSFRIDLLIRYMPYSRMDRTEGVYSFTLKHVANFINDLKFDSVKVVDPHSLITPALLDRCEIIYPLIPEAFKRSFDILFFPDEGAVKKYSKLYPFYQYAFGVKSRNFETGDIDNLRVIGEVKNKNILIIDDICVYGNTFMKAAKELKRLGCKNIKLMVTHCERAVFDGELLKSDLIDSIITTDTILEKSDSNDKLTILNINNLIEEVLLNEKQKNKSNVTV